MRSLIFTLLFLPLIAAAEKKDVLKYYVMVGACPRIVDAEVEVCWNEGKVTRDAFIEKPSDKITTKTSACSESQVKDALAMQEAWFNNQGKSGIRNQETGKGDKVKKGDPKVVAKSCTIITEGKNSSIVAESELKETFNLVDEGDGLSLVMIATVEKVGFKVIKHYLSIETQTDVREEYYMDKICDADGDNKADILMSHRRYYTTETLILKNKEASGFVEGEEEFLTGGGCGC